MAVLILAFTVNNFIKLVVTLTDTSKEVGLEVNREN
jgi:hypothetical protein